MLKKFFALTMANLTIISVNCFAANLVILPASLEINGANPSKAFASDVKQLFAITAEAPTSVCRQSQIYALRTFIYRNAVDNKFAAVYRPVSGNSPCSIHLLSYSNTLKPNLKAGGWDEPSENTNSWCRAEGLRNPTLCSVLIKTS